MEDSDEKGEAKEGTCSFLTSRCRLLTRNPQLWKVLVASGLQMAAATLPDTFVLSLLRARVWGNHMSEYMSYAAIGINSVAVIFGGPYGRFRPSDQHRGEGGWVLRPHQQRDAGAHQRRHRRRGDLHFRPPSTSTTLEALQSSLASFDDEKVAQLWDRINYLEKCCRNFQKKLDARPIIAKRQQAQGR
ncbi:unnamed protein product [Symbiodinium sp. CCMP2592]|nr:unnamed protein product [Symbiodinium sp. CCMP2592]